MLDSLTDGLLGGVIGALAAFLAAYWTIRHERRQRREDVAAAAAQSASDLKHRVAGAAIPMLRALETEIRWGPVLSGRLSRTYLDAMLLVQLVATWMVAQFEGLQRSVLAARRIYVVPRRRRRAAAELANRVALIVSPLVNWAAGVTADDWFAQAANLPAQR